MERGITVVSRINQPQINTVCALSYLKPTDEKKARGGRGERMCLKNIIQKCQEGIQCFLQEIYAKIKNGTAHGRNNANKLSLLFNLKLKVLPNVLILQVCYTICKCYY